MKFELENEYIRLECRPEGGEIKSLWDKKRDLEVLYQGDQGWSGSNPSLFPIIGNTWSKDYEIDGKTYAMKNHGLIRYAVLEGEKEGDTVRFILRADEETKKRYPFDFLYEIAYHLEGPEVHIDYRITNTGDTVMPFTFGLHPAFRVPQEAGETFEDYELIPDINGRATQIVFEPKGEPVTRQEVHFEPWTLDRDTIYKYKTLVFEDFDADRITLACKGEPRVSVEMSQFPLLAIWTHENVSDFVCIEPWYGHADFEPVEEDFYHREGTMLLQPGETFSTGYSIRLEGVE